MELFAVQFERQTEYGTYRDALYFPVDQVPSEADIELMKQARVDNWIAAITAQPVEDTIEVVVESTEEIIEDAE